MKFNKFGAFALTALIAALAVNAINYAIIGTFNMLTTFAMLYGF